MQTPYDDQWGTTFASWSSAANHDGFLYSMRHGAAHLFSADPKLSSLRDQVEGAMVVIEALQQAINARMDELDREAWRLMEEEQQRRAGLTITTTVHGPEPTERRGLEFTRP